MSQTFSVHLDIDALVDVRFLLTRPALMANGDIESGFLNNAIDIQRHPSGRPLAETLCEVASTPGTSVVVVIRNPHLVIDETLSMRVGAAVSQLRALPGWVMGGSGGLGLSDKRHLALYPSATPAIPLPGGPQPLIDVMPDLYLVDAPFAASVTGQGPRISDSALETVLAVEGYMADRVSVFLPSLTGGIDGGLLARDLTRLSDDLQTRFSTRLAGQTIQTLSGGVTITPSPTTTRPATPFGPPELAEKIAAQVERHMEPASLSIVTRTRFDRPHLLRRLLTSISRARRDGLEMEIVLSSDVPRATCENMLFTLQEAFPSLDIQLQHNPDGNHSRVLNLLAGIRAARHDYVLVIDDDDYVDLFAFDALQGAFFAGNRPVIIASSEVHEEQWQLPTPERAVLASSQPVRTYASADWTTMFNGVNSLPVCACIMPRKFVISRLEAVEFIHDLSEDYALFLLLLTAPDLPEICEIPDVICHISLRGKENSVTMPDRRPWARDIAGHLASLTESRRVAGAGLWAVLSANAQKNAPGLSSSIADLRQSLHRTQTQLRLLSRENARLKADIASLEGRTS